MRGGSSAWKLQWPEVLRFVRLLGRVYPHPCAAHLGQASPQRRQRSVPDLHGRREHSRGIATTPLLQRRAALMRHAMEDVMPKSSFFEILLKAANEVVEHVRRWLPAVGEELGKTVDPALGRADVPTCGGRKRRTANGCQSDDGLLTGVCRTSVAYLCTPYGPCTTSRTAS